MIIYLQSLLLNTIEIYKYDQLNLPIEILRIIIEYVLPLDDSNILQVVRLWCSGTHGDNQRARMMWVEWQICTKYFGSAGTLKMIYLERMNQDVLLWVICFSKPSIKMERQSSDGYYSSIRTWTHGVYQNVRICIQCWVFNQDLFNWDVGNVANMYLMLSGASSLRYLIMGYRQYHWYQTHALRYFG